MIYNISYARDSTLSSVIVREIGCSRNKNNNISHFDCDDHGNGDVNNDNDY